MKTVFKIIAIGAVIYFLIAIYASYNIAPSF